AGLHLQHPPTVLGRSYRCSQRVLDFAHLILGTKAPRADRNGQHDPILRRFETVGALTQYLVEQCKGLIYSGTPASEIAILHTQQLRSATDPPPAVSTKMCVAKFGKLSRRLEFP